MMLGHGIRLYSVLEIFTFMNCFIYNFLLYDKLCWRQVNPLHILVSLVLIVEALKSWFFFFFIFYSIFCIYTIILIAQQYMRSSCELNWIVALLPHCSTIYVVIIVWVELNNTSHALSVRKHNGLESNPEGRDGAWKRNGLESSLEGRNKIFM